MRRLRAGLLVALTALMVVATPLVAGAAEGKAGVRWRIQGDLSEACTCSVPCSCNFGQGPSPHHYCWALFSYAIKKGQYGGVRLDGLKVAGAMGEKGIVFYLDNRASKEQADALKAIVERIGETMRTDPALPAETQAKFLGFRTARIVQEVGEKSCRLQIGDAGGFEADYLIGIDGKTPITVGNNASWNLTHCIKAKAKKMQYKDEFGNQIDVEGVNSNQGTFDYNERTQVFIR
jgi:hypothetical protein